MLPRLLKAVCTLRLQQVKVNNTHRMATHSKNVALLPSILLQDVPPNTAELCQRDFCTCLQCASGSLEVAQETGNWATKSHGERT